MIQALKRRRRLLLAIGVTKLGLPLWLALAGMFGVALCYGLLVGWIVDLFLIPSMDDDADRRFFSGSVSYTVAWILLTFFGVLGFHRMYIRKWLTGILYLLTGGFLLIGVLYDYWTLNDQISDINE